MDKLDVSYALAKKVPDMKRGFTIQTSYGEICINAEHAAPFATLAQAMLGKQLEAEILYAEMAQDAATQILAMLRAALPAS